MELNDQLLAQLESMFRLMTTYKIDRLKCGEVEILKTRHDLPKQEGTRPNQASSTEDDILFWSTKTPALTSEQMQAMSINPIEIKKKK